MNRSDRLISDGLIKFNLLWKEGPPPPGTQELSLWRDKLYRLKLVGAYPDGISFGNLSCRFECGFIITGSGTGALSRLSPDNFAFIERWDIKKNLLECSGPCKASSESLTHAALYQARKDIGAVIHVHSKELWEAFLNRIPTTEPEAEYGTPEIALAVKKLAEKDSPEPGGIIAMGGHREGLLIYAATLQEAGELLMSRLDFSHSC